MLSVSKSKQTDNSSQKIVLKSMRKKKKARNSIGSSFGEESSENPKKQEQTSNSNSKESSQLSNQNSQKIKVVRRAQSKRFLTRLEKQKDNEIHIQQLFHDPIEVESEVIATLESKFKQLKNLLSKYYLSQAYMYYETHFN